MQTKITFPNGPAARPRSGRWPTRTCTSGSVTTSSEAAFNLTFWKEGWATVGEYLNTARTAANNAGGLGTPAGNAAFDTSLINRFNTNYGTTSSNAFWTAAPSNPTVGNLFTTVQHLHPPGHGVPGPAPDPRRVGLAAGVRPLDRRHEADPEPVRRRRHHRAAAGGVFHQWLPNQSAACSAKLDTFFTQWFDTAYPTPNNATNKPQITGPGINGPDKFYDDRALAPGPTRRSRSARCPTSCPATPTSA